MIIKKFLSIFLAFIMSFGICSVAFASDEIPEGYTPIYTAEDLDNIRNNLSGKYTLMNDIDLSDYENWEPIGTNDEPFNGEIDGNGFLINNLKIKKAISNSENNLGLFGVAKNSFFKRVIIENGYISLSADKEAEQSNINIITGMIVAKIIGYDFTKVISCSATGKIEVSVGTVVFAGGLVGIGTMDNCILSSSNYVDISINTKNYKQNIYVGGLLGGSSENKESYSESYFRIEKSANFGDISLNNHTCFEETVIFAGGIAGFQISGNELSECYNRGNISALNSSGKLIVGGILGEAIWRLEKSYNSGEISIIADENDMISALCSIKEPYFTFPEGPVMPQDFTVYNCYYLNSSLVPCTQSPDNTFVFYKNVFHLPESDFKNQEKLKFLDFDNVWLMEVNGYPVLQNQPEIIAKETVELVKGEIYSIKVGKTVYSTNNLVATINNVGDISAIGVGKTTINVEYEYNYKTEYLVNVIENPEQPNKPTITDCWIFKFLSCFLNSVYKFFKDLISPLFSIN